MNAKVAAAKSTSILTEAHHPKQRVAATLTRPTIGGYDDILIDAHESAAMSTAEVIFERAKNLPDRLQSEVLHFVEFLLARCGPEAEDTAWARFSASQLIAAYGPADALYDEE
jgi:hypothetical protein